MDNKLPNVNKDKPVWRCVDWSTNKANERFLKGKNRYDPYIYDFALATNGVYTPDEQLVLDGTDKRPCVFRGLGKSPHIHKCIKQNIDYNKYFKIILNLDIILIMSSFFHEMGEALITGGR